MLMSCAIPQGSWSSLMEVLDFFLVKRLKVLLLSENIPNYTCKMHTMTRLNIKCVEHLFLIALPVLSQLFNIGVRLIYVKIKCQSKNLGDYRSVSSHKGMGKKSN